MSNNNEKIILVYTNHFKAYTDPHLYDEHPKQGRIYRAIYNREHGVFKIAFYDESREAEALEAAALGGIIVKELITNNDSWEYNFTEVNKDTLTTLAIEPEDYLKLGYWNENPSRGIEELLTEGKEFDPYYENKRDRERDQEQLNNLLFRVGLQDKRVEDIDFHATWDILKSSNPPLAKAYRSVVPRLLATHTVESVLLGSPAPEIVAHALVNKSLIDYIKGGEPHSLYDAIATLIVLLNVNKEV
jgi:hypothetical protein